MRQERALSKRVSLNVCLPTFPTPPPTRKLQIVVRNGLRHKFIINFRNDQIDFMLCARAKPGVNKVQNITPYIRKASPDWACFSKVINLMSFISGWDNLRADGVCCLF